MLDESREYSGAGTADKRLFTFCARIVTQYLTIKTRVFCLFLKKNYSTFKSYPTVLKHYNTNNWLTLHCRICSGIVLQTVLI